MILSHINNPIELILIFVSFVIALTVHEVAHAYAADRLGDPTARLAGRLTLNPIAHLDPLGTLMLLFAPFGWAKPVPFDPFNLRNPRRDGALISLAGPAANFLSAILAALVLYLIPATVPLISSILGLFIVLNVNLGVFNLIPIHPLDGFKIVEGLLPEHSARQWHQLERLGYVLLLILVFPVFGGSSPVLRFITPIIDGIVNLLIPAAPFI